MSFWESEHYHPWVVEAALRNYDWLCRYATVPRGGDFLDSRGGGPAADSLLCIKADIDVALSKLPKRTRDIVECLCMDFGVSAINWDGSSVEAAAEVGREFQMTADEVLAHTRAGVRRMSRFLEKGY